MKIEVLYPEICNLYGDLFNVKYLEQITNSEVIYTSLTDIPSFVNDDVDMIYMAPMTEIAQKIVIGKLLPYKEKLEEQIEKGTFILFTGNAWEILGQYIENEDGTRIEGLKIIDIYSKRNMMGRENTLFLGRLENIEIVGFKAQFSMSYGDNSNDYAFEALRGWGINKESKLEGIRKNNFFGTYLLGPILVLNPPFLKYVLKLLSGEEKIVFEEEAVNAYNVRLKEFESKAIKY